MKNDDDESFSSFFIQSQSTSFVVGNGNLYTITEVDPLFFLLPPNTDESTRTKNQEKRLNTNQSWQPIDQILGTVDSTLRSCVDPKQLGHLYESLKLSPDETFYRFSNERTLKWLKNKQSNLQKSLEQQQNKLHQNDQSSQKGKGAYAAGFILEAVENSIDPQAVKSNKNNNQQLPKDEQQTEERREHEKQQRYVKIAEEESVQIICSYLNQEWQRKFLEHVNLTDEILLTAKQRVAKRTSSEMTCEDSSNKIMNGTTTNIDGNLNNNAVGQQSTLGNKIKIKSSSNKSVGLVKLEKVNTKGMKKMSAFFQASSKKQRS